MEEQHSSSKKQQDDKHYLDLQDIGRLAHLDRVLHFFLVNDVIGTIKEYARQSKLIFVSNHPVSSICHTIHIFNPSITTKGEGQWKQFTLNQPFHVHDSQIHYLIEKGQLITVDLDYRFETRYEIRLLDLFTGQMSIKKIDINDDGDAHVNVVDFKGLIHIFPKTLDVIYWLSYNIIHNQWCNVIPQSLMDINEDWLIYSPTHSRLFVLNEPQKLYELVHPVTDPSIKSPLLLPFVLQPRNPSPCTVSSMVGHVIYNDFIYFLFDEGEFHRYSMQEDRWKSFPPFFKAKDNSNLLDAVELAVLDGVLFACVPPFRSRVHTILYSFDLNHNDDRIGIWKEVSVLPVVGDQVYNTSMFVI